MTAKTRKAERATQAPEEQAPVVASEPSTVTEAPTPNVTELIDNATQDGAIQPDASASVAAAVQQLRSGSESSTVAPAPVQQGTQGAQAPTAAVSSAGVEPRKRGRPSNAERAARAAAQGVAAPNGSVAAVMPSRESKASLAQKLAAAEAARSEAERKLAEATALGSAEVQKQAADLIAFAADLSSKMVAAQRGPHWEFQPNECETFGQAWAPVAAPYMDRIGKSLPVAMGVMVTWQLLAPRMKIDAQLRAQREKADNAATA